MEKSGDKLDEETVLPQIRTIHLQLQMGKAKGITTGLFKRTDDTTLSKHR